MKPDTPEISKLRNEIMALSIALFEVTSVSASYVLNRMMKEKEEQLKDLQFEEETNSLPFPEK